jgi:membrane protein DedA with SNARE-associated domain
VNTQNYSPSRKRNERVTHFFSIFLGTFVLEDVALASSLALLAEHKITFLIAFMACFLGIAIGDLGLYFLGYLIVRLGIGKDWKILKKYNTALLQIKRSDALTFSIVISRIIPGTRVITYMGAGFLRYSFLKFFALTVSSVFLRVLVALVAGNALNLFFMGRWILSVLTFLLCLRALKFLIPTLADPWKRKAYFQSWRKWSHFEFWPAWFFYLPLVPYYLFLWLKHGSAFAPFYAAPGIKNGGLIGESKWDYLQHLSLQEPSTLKSVKVPTELDFVQVKQLLERHEYTYPLILKPDVGQRGFGVRIIRNDYDLTEYLLLSTEELIVQPLSQYASEAGLFYIRMPLAEKGYLFSVTDKHFPFVMGDGTRPLGDLILADRRARIIAGVYFSRLKEKLNDVPILGERVYLSECGNHCQGAIFLNGRDLITPELSDEVDRIAKQIPHFYFGRFDVRYQDSATLQQGKNWEIVEVNGSGAEATHIWDPSTTLIEAYTTLFQQWSILFSIGSQIKNSPDCGTKVNLVSFLSECRRVFFRKGNLSVSS